MEPAEKPVRIEPAFAHCQKRNEVAGKALVPAHGRGFPLEVGDRTDIGILGNQKK